MCLVFAENEWGLASREHCPFIRQKMHTIKIFGAKTLRPKKTAVNAVPDEWVFYGEFQICANTLKTVDPIAKKECF